MQSRTVYCRDGSNSSTKTGLRRVSKYVWLVFPDRSVQVSVRQREPALYFPERVRHRPTGRERLYEAHRVRWAGPKRETHPE